jgi:hypothetical protein
MSALTSPNPLPMLGEERAINQAGIPFPGVGEGPRVRALEHGFVFYQFFHIWVTRRKLYRSSYMGLIKFLRVCGKNS